MMANRPPEGGGQEGAGLHGRAGAVVVAYLYRRAGDAHNGPGLEQAGVMRMRLVAYRRVGAVVAVLVPYPMVTNLATTGPSIRS